LETFEQLQSHKNYERMASGIWGPEWLTKHSAKFLPDCLDPKLAGDRGWIYDHVFNGYPVAVYNEQQPKLVLLVGTRGDGSFDEATQSIFINILRALKAAYLSGFGATAKFLTHVYLHELIHSLAHSTEEKVERATLILQGQACPKI